MDKRQTKKKLLLTLTLLILTGYCLLLTQVVPAEGAESVGSFTHVEGKVDVMRGGAPAMAVKKGDPVFVKDIVRTKSDSKAEIVFSDGNILRLAQRTRIDISEYSTDSANTKEVIKLPRGKVEAVVEKKLAQRVAVSPQANRFEIHTPNAVAGVRGTRYFVFHFVFTGVLVKDGTVGVYNPKIPNVVVPVHAGTFTTVSANNPPETPKKALETDAKQHEKDVAPTKKEEKSEPDKKTDSGDSQTKTADTAKTGTDTTLTQGDADKQTKTTGTDKTGTEPDKNANGQTGQTGQTGQAGQGATGAQKQLGGGSGLQTGTFTTIQSAAAVSAVSVTSGITTTTVITQPVTETVLVPTVEVGRTTLSGALVAGATGDMNYLSVSMRDVVYLATSSGNKPSIWSTNAISGSYIFGNHLNSGNITNNAINISNGSGIDGTFQFNQFGGSWSATVNGGGTLSGGSYTGNINMTGTASGTAGGGSLSGTGKGDVK